MFEKTIKIAATNTYSLLFFPKRICLLGFFNNLYSIPSYKLEEWKDIMKKSNHFGIEYSGTGVK